MPIITRCRGAGFVLLALLASGTARAQTSNSGTNIGPSQQATQPAPPPAPAPAPAVEHLFGDWGGVRTRLGDLGIDLVIDATTEFAGNVSGGTKQGATFANQVGFEADLDWGKLAGLDGFSTHTALVNRSGSSDSTLFGDHLIPVQEIFGAGGSVVVHFVYTYLEQQWLGGRVDLTAGRMPVGNDFAASPLYCNFMNNSICGNPIALSSGDNGFSAFPDANWGARLRVRPRDDVSVQAGVYEVNQGIYGDPYFRTGFEFDTSQDSGVLLPVEVSYQPRLGTAALPGHYTAGFAYDSSHFQSFSGAGPAHVGNTQVWVLADQMLLRQGDGDTAGLIALAAFVRNDPRVSVYAEQYTAGLLDQGFWKTRPQDTAGLLFSYNTVSGTLGNLQGLEQQAGLPLSNTATGIQTHEMILEVNYDIHVTSGVNLQPEFQYVFRPSAQGNIRDATVFGFKAHVTF